MGRNQIVTRNKEKLLIPSPSTMFNLACSDSHKGFMPMGCAINLIGDSFAGKTVFALSILAEMANRKEFDDYLFLYDPVEPIDNFDLVKSFGKKTSDRLQTEFTSETIQDFEKNLMGVIEKKKFIYVLDSFDALTSKEEQNKKEGKVSYKTEKVKLLTELLRKTEAPLKRLNSNLIIISQTRDNFDAFSFSKTTRAGGRALKFYSYLEIWLSHLGRIKVKNRTIGNRVTAKITKNKITGNLREVSFPIYVKYGVDDIESMIDFLCEEGVFTKGEKTILVKPLGLKGIKRKIIEQIENQNLEQELKLLCEKKWLEIEKSIEIQRKRKYE